MDLYPEGKEVCRLQISQFLLCIILDDPLKPHKYVVSFGLKIFTSVRRIVNKFPQLI